MYNKSTKSEVATRIKKVSCLSSEHEGRASASPRLHLPQVLVAVAASQEGKAEASVVDALLSEAYKCIDQAAAKGIIKANTAARRKSLVARTRNAVDAVAA